MMASVINTPDSNQRSQMPTERSYFAKRQESEMGNNWISMLKYWLSEEYQRPRYPDNAEIKLYKRRFWMLFVYCASSFVNALLYIQFSIISNIVQCYYNVGPYDVNWTSTVYMIIYVVLVLPVSWFIDRFNLKVTVVAGAVINFIGTAIQCVSLNRDGFPIVMVAQTLASISDVFILPIPPRLAAIWFGPNEICRATAIGVFGNQFGQALGNIIPPLIVSNDCSQPEKIKTGLGILAYSLTGVNFVVLLLSLFAFEARPLHPPSEVSKREEKTEYKKSLRNLAKNFNFYWLFATYGIAIGVIIAISTLINQMLSPVFKNSETAIGWIGAVQVFSGFVGAYIFGFTLDMTQKYKIITLFICFLGTLSIILFTILIYFTKLLWVQFITVGIIGFFLTGFFPVGFEFANEITYPEPEGTVAGLMNTAIVAFGFVITMVGSYLLQNYSLLIACAYFAANVGFAFITAAFIKLELRRTEKNKENDNSCSTQNQL